MVLCQQKFQSALNWQIAKESDQDTYNKVWLKSEENWEGSRVLKTINLEILQSAPNDPKPKSRNRVSKLPYVCAL